MKKLLLCFLCIVSLTFASGCQLISFDLGETEKATANSGSESKPENLPPETNEQGETVVPPESGSEETPANIPPETNEQGETVTPPASVTEPTSPGESQTNDRPEESSTEKETGTPESSVSESSVSESSEPDTPAVDGTVPRQLLFASLSESDARLWFPFFYRLTDVQRKLYNTLAQGVIDQLSEIPVDVPGSTSADVGKAAEALLNDQPQIFWFTGATNTSTLNGVVKKITPSYHSVNVAAARGTIDGIVNQVKAAVNGQSAVAKERYIHDFVCNLVTYGTSANDQTVYGSLIEHRAVCAGYTRAFQLLMMGAGVPCYYCSGSGNNGHGTEKHAWNIVELGGGYYNLDTTWDDQDAIFYDYFNLTDAEIGANHTREGGAILPGCNATQYSFENVYGMSRAVASMISYSGVTTVMNSADEYIAMRKAEIQKNVPGTTEIAVVVPTDAVKEAIEAHITSAESGTYLNDFAAAAGLTSYSISSSHGYSALGKGAYVIRETIVIEGS